MTEALIKFKAPGPVLARYLASEKFVQIIRGPLGSGKTTTTAFKVFELICNQKANSEGVRKSRVAVVRNTYPDLTNTTIRDWRSIVPDGCGKFTMGHPPEHALDFDLPDGTRVMAEVIFIALDKPDDVRKLRGMQLTFAWINEAKEVPLAIIAMLTGRIDRYPKQGYSTWVGILGDSNAWDQDHELEKWAQDAAEGDMPGYEFFVQPGGVIKVNGKWVVNPDRENQEWIGPEYYERQIPGKKEDWIKVNLGNQIGYSFDGKPVHADYSDTYHVSDTVLTPNAGVVRVGMDFGLTPAAVFKQRQSNGQWWIFDEIVCEDAGADEFALEIKAKAAEWDSLVPGLSWVFRGDPAGDERQQTNKQTVYQVLRLNGVQAIAASTNDVQVRRAALDRPLTRTVEGGKPGLLVSPVCRVFRKGMAGGFCYKRVQIAAGEERYRDVPDKNKFSHVVEACEYGLMDGGEHAVRNPPPQSRPQMPVGQQTRTSSWNPLDV